jgi:hypothetical protein
MLKQHNKNMHISKQLTYDDAHKHCCSLGMHLLSVDLRDTLDCLTGMTCNYPTASAFFPFMYPK